MGENQKYSDQFVAKCVKFMLFLYNTPNAKDQLHTFNLWYSYIAMFMTKKLAFP